MPSAPAQRRLLLLGDTAEVRALAKRLEADRRFAVSHLRNRPNQDILAADAQIVIDAQDLPMAPGTEGHYLRLLGPAFRPEPGDRWIEAADWEDAASLLPSEAKNVLMEAEAEEVFAFAPRTDIWFLVRMRAAPEIPLPLTQAEVLLADNSRDAGKEAALITNHQIDCVIARNSGLAGDRALIEAARSLELPVVLVMADHKQAGPVVRSAEEALAWLAALPRA